MDADGSVSLINQVDCGLLKDNSFLLQLIFLVYVIISNHSDNTGLTIVSAEIFI